MRSPSEDLFKLVKTMNKGEKRNFKLLAGMMAGDKKYIELFDLVDRQSVYDEAKILKSGITRGQLSAAKNYLYKFLLRSLVYSRSNPKGELVQLTEQVKVLIAKNLYSQASKLLKKALLLAKQIEAFEVHLELLDNWAQVLLETLPNKEITQDLEQIHQEKSLLLVELQHLQEFGQLHTQVKLLQNSRLRIKGLHEKKQIEEILDHPLIKAGLPNSSLRAKLIYLKIIRKIYSYKDLPEKAATYAHQLLEVYRSSEILVKAELGDYFREVSNLCTYYFRSGRPEKSFQLMEELRMARHKYKHSEVEFFQQYYLLQMAYAIHTGQPEHGFSFLAEIEEELAQVKGKTPASYLQWLFYLIAYLYFTAGKYAEASTWLERFFSEPRTDFLNDLPGLARLLKMLIHFQLQEYDLLETETTNVQRFLDRKGKHTRYEYEVIRGIRTLVRETGMGQDRSAYEKVRNSFSEAMKSGAEADFHDLLNFELWLQAELEGSTMAQLKSSSYQRNKIQ